MDDRDSAGRERLALRRANARRLEQIAALLGVPAATFFEARRGDQLSELLSLWDGLPDDAAREAVLRTARAVAGRP